MEPVRSAIVRLLGDLARDQIRRAVVAFTMWTLAFVIFFVAIGFTIGGIYVTIKVALGPIAASFIMAAGTLVFSALLVMIAGRNLSSGRRSRRAEIDEFTDDHPGATGLGDIVAAFGFGLVQGLSRRRKRRE
jgi:hypothetical protein